MTMHSKKNQAKKIILCGLPCAGKTTEGRKMAERLKLPFIDTDDLIELAYFVKTGHKTPCREIYHEHGELYFRTLEKEEIAKLKNLKSCVIALGGGALCDKQNQTFLSEMGHIIYLKVSLDTVWNRLQTKGMPATLDSSDPKRAFEKMAHDRIHIFEKIANEIIEL